MSDATLDRALDRAERALDRAERALAAKAQSSGRDDALRARVRDALAELDDIIQAAEA